MSSGSVQTPLPPRNPKRVPGALRRYRIMAIVTGVVLLLGCVLLILQDVGNVSSIKTVTGLVWVAHGYLFLVYLAATLDLGMTTRWSWARLILSMAAGTIPTMSFVAEHLNTRYVRRTYGAVATPARS